MSIIFVTGTGTDIGKTIATATLTAGFTHAAQKKQTGGEVVVVKPAQTGFPGTIGGDLDTIRELTGCTSTVGFARYPEAMAPVAAAERAHMPLLTVEETAQKIRDLDVPGTTVIVEGAGGLLVRLGGPKLYGPRTGEWAMPDLAKLLPEAQTVLVTGTHLGSLNEAELTVEVAKARGMNVAGLIAGSAPAALVGIADAHAVEEADTSDAIDDLDTAICATNLRDMADLTKTPFLAVIPYGSGKLSREEFTQQASTWLTTAGRCWIDQIA